MIQPLKIRIASNVSSTTKWPSSIYWTLQDKRWGREGAGREGNRRGRELGEKG